MPLFNYKKLFFIEFTSVEIIEKLSSRCHRSEEQTALRAQTVLSEGVIQWFWSAGSFRRKKRCWFWPTVMSWAEATLRTTEYRWTTSHTLATPEQTTPHVDRASKTPEQLLTCQHPAVRVAQLSKRPELLWSPLDPRPSPLHQRFPLPLTRPGSEIPRVFITAKGKDPLRCRLTRRWVTRADPTGWLGHIKGLHKSRDSVRMERRGEGKKGKQWRRLHNSVAALKEREGGWAWLILVRATVLAPLVWLHLPPSPPGRPAGT